MPAATGGSILLVVTTDELEALLEELRATGFHERTNVDWKGKWYAFKHEEQKAREKAKNDFVADITSLANARTTERRLLIYGVNTDGAIEEAPLPEGEHDLQSRLKVIYPHPDVSFRNVPLRDGTMLSVAEVTDASNPPYVAKKGDLYYVYVRRGSTTSTATRGELDQWYQAKELRAQLVMCLGPYIEIEPGGKYSYTRPRQEPPQHPEPTHGVNYEHALQQWHTRVHDGKQADRVVEIPFTLANKGSGPAEHVVVEFTVSGVQAVSPYGDPRRGQPVMWPPGYLDKAAVCYVDRYALSYTDSLVEITQRLQRVNPRGRERLVSIFVLCDEPTPGEPPRATIDYEVTDGKGTRTSGAFTIERAYEVKDSPP